MSDRVIPAGLEAAGAAAPGAEFEVVAGDDVARVPPDELVGFVEQVRSSGYAMFVDLCAVDYFTREPRFEVAINVVSVSPPRRLRILVGVPGDQPVLPTITGVYPGANFYEREAWDLLGIEFEGHPDLTRILLPDEWVGHPLRKDSAVGSVPVQFKEANKAT